MFPVLRDQKHRERPLSTVFLGCDRFQTGTGDHTLEKLPATSLQDGLPSAGR